MKKMNIAAMMVVASTLALSACSSKPAETTAATTVAETTAEVTTEAETQEETTVAEAREAEGGVQLRMGQVQAAAHGDKCFTIATAVIDENDAVAAAYIDEYQFLGADTTGVPNSEAFHANGDVKEENVLASKRVNHTYYSEMMKKAGATKEIAANFDEIQSFAAGKTIAELEELGAKPAEEVLDAVSGATLVDAAGYVNAIVSAAKAAQENEAVAYAGDLSALKLNVVEAAAHGDKCFTVAAALTDGTNVVLSYIDEFQFLTAGDVEAVPNSDAFAEAGYVAEGKALASKRVNNAFYSEMMAKAGATKEIAANYDEIQSYVNGKTIAELEELTGKTAEEALDAVSGATLVDTLGYVTAIAEAAKK